MSAWLRRDGSTRFWGARQRAGLGSLLCVGCLLCLKPASLGQGVPITSPDLSSGGVGPVPRRGDQQSATDLKPQQQAEQRRRIELDAAKLVRIANELKLEVDRSPKDQLSMSALRKAQSIEKTAHDFQAWMKY